MAAATSVNRIESAHQMYREGRHKEALSFYTEALAMAKTKPQKIALHSNRAACYLKLHNFKKAAEECTSVLELDRNHTGALMLRAQTLVTLKEYQSALFDVSRLMELNPSSEVYRDLQERLKTQLSLAPIPESEVDEEEEDEIEPKETEKEGKRVAEGKYLVSEVVERAQEVEHESITPMVEVIALTNNASPSQTTCFNKSSDQVSKGWKTIPKPKGHSNLDYSRWDAIEDDSSEDEDDDDEGSEPQYQFRVKTVGVRSVK